MSLEAEYDDLLGRPTFKKEVEYFLEPNIDRSDIKVRFEASFAVQNPVKPEDDYIIILSVMGVDETDPVDSTHIDAEFEYLIDNREPGVAVNTGDGLEYDNLESGFRYIFQDLKDWPPSVKIAIRPRKPGGQTTVYVFSKGIAL